MSDPDTVTIPQRTTRTLTLSEDEARWLATAVTILQRILRDSSEHPGYSAEGLRVLHRVAEYLPSGYYPAVDEHRN
jgi:hypothetical protein